MTTVFGVMLQESSALAMAAELCGGRQPQPSSPVSSSGACVKWGETNRAAQPVTVAENATTLTGPSPVSP